jgi:murein DD-endopeptidase MepM/ murein hydrolase activator NlpD
VDARGGRHRRLAIVGALGLALAGCSGTPAAPAGGGTTAAPATSPASTASSVAPATSSAGTGTGGAPATTRKAAGPERFRYRFPVAGCPARYGRAHHDYPAADMFTGRGCAFVAPVDARVDEVSRTDRWDPASDRGADRGGRSVSLVGADGVRYYGSHLEAVAAGVVPGAQVRAGQLLGRVGDSGSARGTPTHLHFGISWPTGPGIWWVRRGMVAPWPYLDSWRAGGDRAPAGAGRAARAAAGEVPPCRARC